MSNTKPLSPSGLELLQSWIRDGRRAPIAEALDINLAEVENGRALFTGTPSERVYNPFGVVHGGYVATLLDSACACAAHSSLPPERTQTTLELKVVFHRPIRWNTGPVRAEGKVVSIGQRVAFAEARLTDARGELYASATSTLLLMDLDAPPPGDLR